MNERIQELAKQAGGNPNYSAFRGHFLPPPPDYIDPATVDLEKFAELIVEECIFAIDEQCSNSDAEGTIEAITILQKHFGVES